ncbi:MULTISPECIES: DUF3696 domain-containing protein [Pantoea]|uniref:DUF3696 domain-containing protein n=1 Tax=Pantoea TaxID=53335 RepID=UPI00057DFE23|nr:MULTISPECIES: DUF3696 domain-containing protein [Pantoea]
MKNIKALQITALKSFTDAKISLGQLTVLSGLNGSGKSTFIQAIRMLLSAVDNKTPFLKGFGDYEELKSKNALRSQDIRIEVFTDDAQHALSIGKESYEVIDKSLDIKFDYICAARLGPSTSLPVMDHGEKKITVGSMGEYLVDYFTLFSDISINADMLHSSSSSTTLEIQLNSWMSEISPGVKLLFSKVDKHDMSHVEIDTYRSTNTGFGISYALPIVMSLLVLSSTAVKDKLTNEFADDWITSHGEQAPLLIIENPEAHLHPRGQTAIGELVAKAAAAGVQIIIETHSDHFIDGIRIAVKENKIDKKNVLLKFFEKTKEGSSFVTDIVLSDDGSIEDWPEGYFDQMFTNLKRLSS